MARLLLLQYLLFIFLLLVLSSELVGVSSATDAQFQYTMNGSREQFSLLEPNHTSYNGTKPAYGADGAVWLTPDPETAQELAKDIANSNVGRFIFSQPIRFAQASFNTSFEFQIVCVPDATSGNCGDGLAFFIAPQSAIPANSTGGSLGVMGNSSASPQFFFAVEFDTFLNAVLKDPSSSHIGIDFNSLVSDVTADTSANESLNLRKNNTFLAWVEYSASNHQIQVWMTNINTTSKERPAQPILETQYDLSTIFNEYMYVGFSASTGFSYEGHALYAWNFSTQVDLATTPSPSPARSTSSDPPGTRNYSNATAGGAEGHVRKGGWLIGVGVAAAVLVAVGTVGCASLLWRRRSSGGARRPSIMGWNLGHDEEPDDVVSGAGPVRFQYQELVEATNNFSESLGQGGFGKVYKGWVRGKRGISYTGEKQVAVKVLSSRGEERSDSSESQFRAEVLTLGQIHHINLVILLGYCTSGKPGRAHKRLLVYEYMQKGSLDRFLYAAHVQQPLPWATRYSIALGTARGIAYLHHDCNPRILHCDIKPQNVLLDDDFSAKVADFGFARRFRHRDSHLSVSHTCGTRGYMAPEWLKSEGITSKVDVYSFGMLLLELVRGLNTGNDHLPLLHWAFQCISAGVLVLSQLQAGHSTDDNIDVDGPNSVTDVGDREQADNQQEEAAEKLRLLKVGLWCVQPIPSLRPEMSRVVQLIEGTVSVPNPPNPVPEETITNLNQILDSGLSSSSYVNSYSILFPR